MEESRHVIFVYRLFKICEQPGDILLNLNHVPIEVSQVTFLKKFMSRKILLKLDYETAVAGTRPGDTVLFEIQRGDSLLNVCHCR